MYEAFFGLSGKPFSLLPDADFLYFSKHHRSVVNLLEYGTAAESGFIVITGDVGAGKTTVIRHYLRQLGEETAVGIITNPTRQDGQLLRWVHAAFELGETVTDEIQLYNRFVEYLLSNYARGKRTVLIVDEAQNLSPDRLEELRMLSNVNNERDQLLQIILAGQPELLESLKRDDLRQLVQRIAVHYHLTPMEPFETAAYIRHRLSVVGGGPEMFDDHACAAVHYFTQGVPRLINLLCDQSLMYAFAEDQFHVTFQLVGEVVADRSRGGLSPFRPIAPDQTEEGLLRELETILEQIRQRPRKKRFFGNG